MQLIIYPLLTFLDELHYSSTDGRIAKSMLANLDKIPDSSLNDFAFICNVSPATLNRFIRRLGFFNFSTFRELSKIDDNPHPIEFTDHEQLENYQEVLFDSLKAVDEISSLKIRNVVDYIYLKKHVLIIGYGDFQYPARYLQNLLMTRGKLIYLCTQAEMAQKIIQNTTSEDLIIFVSFGGRYLKTMQRPLENNESTKILISKNVTDGMDRSFCIRLSVQDGGIPSIQKYVLMRLFERLGHEYCNRYFSR